jgi:hypothetical protein
MDMQSAFSRVALLILMSCCAAANSQMQALKSSAGHNAERSVETRGVAADVETEAVVQARLTQADGTHRGDAWLQISAEADGAEPAHVMLRIPFSSTEDVYGESRSCKVQPSGAKELTFTAGMDEKNFLRFAAGKKTEEIRVLLNKYLCRALAAPFHCDGREVALPRDWSEWRLASSTSVLLTSDAPAALEVTPVEIEQSGQAFDAASCAVIAPSNGLCCVANKTTEWHCGGTPAGAGWHQVSGECFHRETGGSCTEKTVFGPLKPME